MQHEFGRDLEQRVRLSKALLPRIDQRVLAAVLGIGAPGGESVASFTKGLVFIAAAFTGPASSKALSAIKDGCSRLGLQANPVNDNVGSGFIIREITELIERAEFLIFDLTKERPNVYYELGYAHGVGNKALDILLVARKGTKLHFDIAPLRVHFYRSREHLKRVVSKNLRKMMHLTRKPGHRGASRLRTGRRKV